MLSFAEYIGERQRIWFRRYVLNDDAPWTDDSVLSKFRFCNVQRELDRGTRTVIDKIVGLGDLQLVALNVMMYRMFNRDQLWRETIGVVYDRADVKSAFDRVRESHTAGMPVFTSAFTISPLLGLPGETRIDRVEWAVDRWIDDPPIIDQNDTHRDVLHKLVAKPAVGPFIGWQMALDIGYAINASQDDWIFIYKHTSRGTPNEGGSHIGMRHAGVVDGLDGVRRLRDTQDEWLPETWRRSVWDDKTRLTLVDLEGCFCEYSKYYRKATGIKTYMRRFA